MKNREEQTILLIEDNPGDIRLVKEMLNEIKSYKYNLISAESLKEGCEQIRKNNLVLILLDLNLPDSRGKATFDTVIKFSENIPIVLISGLQDEQLSLSLIKEGAQDYILKQDLNSNLLAKTIQYAVIRKNADVELHASKNFLDKIINSVASPIFVKDANHNLCLVNDAYCSLLNLPVEKIIGTNGYDYFTENQMKVFIAKDNEAMKTGVENINEEQIFDGTGKMRTFVTRKTLYIDSDGNKFLVGVSDDITERKQMDNQINKLSQAVEQSPVSVVITDLDGNIEYANPMASETTGYSFEELIGKNPRVLKSGETPQEEYEGLWKTLCSGNIWKGTFHNKKKNGELYWESATITPVLNENGIVTNYLAIKEDISQLKIDEQQILDLNQNLEKKISERTTELANANTKLILEVEERIKSEQKFEVAFHSSSAMMAISDMETGLYLDVNNTWLDTLEYTREEIMGKTYNDLGIINDPDLRNKIITDILSGIPVRDLEVIIFTKYGSKVIGSVSADLIYIGDRRYLLSVIHDITDLKIIEEELQNARIEAEKANVAKSEFLSRMSHELRTPMNSILGFAQLLEMTELNIRQKNSVKHIRHSGAHLLELINQVLDISRIESGRLSITFEPVELFGIFNEMIDILNPLASEYKIRFKITESPIDKLFVNADRQSFKQIMLNLLSNAIKYNNVGGIVEIKTEIKKDKKNDSSIIRITIADNGVGIKPQDIAKLFMPFERIGYEISEIEGTGLGLAVVKKLTEAMNGICGVESVYGKGSAFWIELPQEEQYSVVESSEIYIEPIQVVTSKKGTVLYIEDNIPNIELVEQILSSQRPLIRLITNIHGKQTLKLAIKNKPELILLDLNLPDINGFEVLNLILNNKDTKDIPVVILSADGMRNQINKLMEAGAKKYLTKPLDVGEFLRTIDEYI